MAILNTIATRSLDVDASPGVASTTLARGVFWWMLAAKLLGGWGLRWDIQWHLRIGRDSFWIAPHVMTYASVGLVVLLSFGLLAAETARHRSGPVAAPMMRPVGVLRNSATCAGVTSIQVLKAK